MNEEIMRKAGFGEAAKDVSEHKCPICKQRPRLADFRDRMSFNEFVITGLCQQCQDKMEAEDE